MHGLMLFFHLSGLAIWLGSLVAATIMLALTKKQPELSGSVFLVRRTVRVFNMLTHPSAFIVLLTGVLMILTRDYGDGGFWLNYMQNVGGVIVLLSIIVLSILSGKIVNKKALAEGEEIRVQGEKLGTFITVALITIILVLSVILVVSYR